MKKSSSRLLATGLLTCTFCEYGRIVVVAADAAIDKTNSSDWPRVLENVLQKLHNVSASQSSRMKCSRRIMVDQIYWRSRISTVHTVAVAVFRAAIATDATVRRRWCHISFSNLGQHQQRERSARATTGALLLGSDAVGCAKCIFVVGGGGRVSSARLAATTGATQLISVFHKHSPRHL